MTLVSPDGRRAPADPQAVVFDLDGLLVDSEPAWARADRRVVEDLGGRWEDGLHRRLVGRGPLEAAAVVAAFLGNRHRPEEIAVRVLAAVEDEFDGGLRARPGAVALVTALHGRMPLAVATNSPRTLADRALVQIGLAGAFEAVVSVDDVARPKPAPDPYRSACDGCGADPARSAALEDSPGGAEAARSAGLWVIGCPSVPGVEITAAHELVADLREVATGWLVQSSVTVGSRGRRDSPT